MRTQVVRLIFKDVGVYRYRILGLLALSFGVVLFVILMPNEGNIAGSFVAYCGLFAALSGTMWFIDELKGNSMSMSASLPVTRRAIVVAKYLASLMISCVSIAACAVAYAVLSSLLGLELPQVVTGKIAGIATLFVLFHTAVFYAAFFRFGVIVTFVVYAFSQFVPILVLIKFWRTKDSFQPYFENQDLTLFVVIGGITLLLAGVSFYTSMRHYEQKDLRG